MARPESTEMTIPYQLVFIVQSKPLLDVIHAEIRSPSLHTILHPEGVLLASFGTRYWTAGEGNRRFSLQSFQLDSLLGYLANQEDIRQIIEAELTKERAA